MDLKNCGMQTVRIFLFLFPHPSTRNQSKNVYLVADMVRLINVNDEAGVHVSLASAII